MPRGDRISTHLHNQSVLIQTLQSRTTNLGKRTASVHTDPTASIHLHVARKAVPLLLRPCLPSWASWIVRNLTGVTATPSQDSEHRQKQFLSLNRSHTTGKCAPRELQKHKMWMMQYHRIMALRCPCATMSWLEREKGCGSCRSQQASVRNFLALETHCPSDHRSDKNHT